MSAIIRLPDGELVSEEADHWRIMPGGILNVLDAEDSPVATFNHGEWNGILKGSFGDMLDIGLRIQFGPTAAEEFIEEALAADLAQPCCGGACQENTGTSPEFPNGGVADVENLLAPYSSAPADPEGYEAARAEAEAFLADLP